MNKTFSLEEILPVMREQLENGKTVSFVPNGNSMLPMLHGGEDMVLLKKPEGRLHLSDVAFYYRRETDSYVIHRVAGFQKDGSYIMLGDNNVAKEYNIKPEDIIAVVTAFYRKGKMYTTTHPIYRLYCEYQFYSRPFRRGYRTLKSKVKSTIKRG
ncbi:MAG: S24/S26 family peptidase [Ruminococcus sp.]|nr:S24/S26 family peptidase [Ruminococcus sp.]